MSSLRVAVLRNHVTPLVDVPKSSVNCPPVVVPKSLVSCPLVVVLRNHVTPPVDVPRSLVSCPIVDVPKKIVTPWDVATVLDVRSKPAVGGRNWRIVCNCVTALDAGENSTGVNGTTILLDVNRVTRVATGSDRQVCIVLPIERFPLWPQSLGLHR
jgi:hypothetical protein